jgi:hypothetical protein
VILHVRNYSPINTVTYQKSSISNSTVAEPQDLLLFYALKLIAIAYLRITAVREVKTNVP